VGIALFPAGEPLRISISAEWCPSKNGALIGFGLREGGSVFGIAVLEDGQVQSLALNEFKVDWQYDVATDQWVDVNARRAAEADQEI
jgi:hypothetical protein